MKALPAEFVDLPREAHIGEWRYAQVENTEQLPIFRVQLFVQLLEILSETGQLMGQEHGSVTVS